MLGILCQTCFDIKYQLKEYATYSFEKSFVSSITLSEITSRSINRLVRFFRSACFAPGMSRFFLVGELLDLILYFCNLFVNVFHKLSFLYVFCLS